MGRDDKDQEREERRLRKAKEFINSATAAAPSNDHDDSNRFQTKNSDGHDARRHRSSHTHDDDDSRARRSRKTSRDHKKDRQGRHDTRHDDDNDQKHGDKKRHQIDRDLAETKDEGRKRHKHKRHDDDKRRKRDKTHHDDDDRKSRASKKHRRHHDDDERRRRKDPKKKDKKQSSSSKTKRSSSRRKDHGDDDDKSKKDASSTKQLPIDKKTLVHLGDPPGVPPAQLIDPAEDYFAFHQQLWVYLYREEGITFSDLESTEQARQAFGRFVKRYNSGQLERAYYEGLPSAALEECKTTRHDWALKISTRDDDDLHALQAAVRRQTEYSKDNNNNNRATTNDEKQDTNGSEPAVLRSKQDGDDSKRKRDTEVATAGSREPSYNTTRDRAATERVANRRLREHVRVVDEEITGGRKEGKERQIEKRRQVGEKTHGAHQDRDAAMELTDDALFGGEGQGEAGFQQALQREKARSAKRQEQKANRVAELEQKEKDKQEAMLKMLGLTGIKPGHKITIAPRNDG